MSARGWRRPARSRIAAILAAPALALGLAAAVAPNAARAEEEEVPELRFEPVEDPAAPRAAQAPQGAQDPGLLSLPALDVEWVRPFNKAVRIGDALELKVSGAPEGAASLAPMDSPEALNEQGWELGAADESSGKPAAGELWFVATPIKKGTLTLPSLVVRDAGGNAVARTNPFSLAVQSAIAADDPHPDKPADLRPPEELPFPWAIVGGAVLGLLALLAAAYYFYRRWRKSRLAPKPVVPAPKPFVPEDQEAYAALDELERKGYLAQGKFKPHYFRVSEILKAYLGRRYDFDALESTSHELIERLGRHETLETVRGFDAIFQAMDVVKFTDRAPTPAEAAELAGEARKLIRKTARIAPAILPPDGPAPGKPGHAL